MQYLSQGDVNALAALKRQNAQQVLRTASIERRRDLERTADLHFWLRVAVVVLIGVVVWVVAHLQAMRTLYKPDVEWFETRYVLGPRPEGADHVGLDCLLFSAEYPAFAQTFLSQSCDSLPQTSALFLLTMIQTFGQHMQGIHYSGSGEQLRAKRFPDFIKSFGAWDVPDNPWRFLFRDKSQFALSVAVQKAQGTPNGETMLRSLFQGGLCAVARRFYKPDVDAPMMCRELLDEQLVYVQSCEAAKLAHSVQLGSSVGSLVGPLASSAVGGSISTPLVSAAGSLMGTATDSIGASGLATLTGDTASTLACAAAGPFYPLCVAAMLAIVAGVAAGITLATTAAISGVAYAAVPCPFSQYYTYVMQSDGTYKKEAWNGDPADLPPRAKETKSKS